MKAARLYPTSAILWLLASTAAADTVALDGAALKFDAPEGLEPIEPTRPELFAGVWRTQSSESARLRVFVVPASPSDDDELAREAARSVARYYSWVDDWGEPSVEGALTIQSASGQDGFAYLVMRRVDYRRVALLLTAKSSANSSLEAVRKAARSVAPTDDPIDASLGSPVTAPGIGFRVSPPRDFLHEAVDGDLILLARPRPHLGLIAELEVSRVTDALDEALMVAATRRYGQVAMMARSAGSSHGVIAPVAGSDGTAGLAWLIDFPKHRVEVTWRFEESLRAALGPLMEATLDSIEEIPRVVRPTLAETYTDSEGGFSMRVPAGFAREPRSDVTAAFRERWVRGEPAWILVRSLKDPASDHDECRAIADRIVAASGRDVGPVSTHVVNGNPAVSFELAGEDDVAERHWLLAAGGRALQLTLTATTDELALLIPVAEAVVRTLRPQDRIAAPDLAAAVSDSTGTVTIRPPSGWTSNDDPEGSLSFVEPAESDAARVLVVSRAWDDREPGEPILPGSVAQRIASQLVGELRDEGYEIVRLEDATVLTDGTVLLRLAYVDHGRSVRELASAIPHQGRVWLARAVTPAARYGELQELLDACRVSFRLQ